MSVTELSDAPTDLDSHDHHDELFLPCSFNLPLFILKPTTTTSLLTATISKDDK